ncbi:HVO_2922 family protein [Haloarcula japonica]|uniref:HVO_2922 family protein n=1 Tax=Haloarcula japonica TaxID=29282 RepID=UPI0039F6610C
MNITRSSRQAVAAVIAGVLLIVPLLLTVFPRYVGNGFPGPYTRTDAIVLFFVGVPVLFALFAAYRVAQYHDLFGTDSEDHSVSAGPEIDHEHEPEYDDGSLVSGPDRVEEEVGIETGTAASKATFEVYTDNTGDYRWRLVHQNRNIIADSGQGYASKQKVKQGLESVRNNAPDAYVIDQSKDEEVPEGHGSNATFELFEDAGEKWRWRLRHDNGNIIADSGQGYSSKKKATQGLQSVQKNTPRAPSEETR